MYGIFHDDDVIIVTSVNLTQSTISVVDYSRRLFRRLVDEILLNIYTVACRLPWGPDWVAYCSSCITEYAYLIVVIILKHVKTFFNIQGNTCSQLT